MSKKTYKIVTIDRHNLSNHPEVICFINPKNESYQLKIEWIKKRLSEGLRIKLLYLEGQKRSAGFIEYVPGENAWRAVSAKGYMFIHCIFVYLNKNKGKGAGTLLIKECLKDAKAHGCLGVAVVTSSDSFMAGNDLFLKNGFKVVEKSDSNDELLVRSFKKGPLPKLNDWKKRLAGFKGLNIVYSKQCPWVARFVKELQDTAAKESLKLKITELKTPAQAQRAPSVYATFNLVYNGRLLADRYISATRFRNILREEKLI